MAKEMPEAMRTIEITGRESLIRMTEMPAVGGQ
jgi:hypothetical protein